VRPRYAGGPKTSVATVLQAESIRAVSGVRTVVLGRVTTLMMLNKYREVAKRKSRWKVLVEGVVRATRRTWHNRESELHARRAARREQKASGEEDADAREAMREREVDMLCEGVRQLRTREPGDVTRELEAAEVRGVEAALSAVTLTDVAEPGERQERRVRFQ